MWRVALEEEWTNRAQREAAAGMHNTKYPIQM